MSNKLFDLKILAVDFTNAVYAVVQVVWDQHLTLVGVVCCVVDK